MAHVTAQKIPLTRGQKPCIMIIAITQTFVFLPVVAEFNPAAQLELKSHQLFLVFLKTVYSLKYCAL